MTDIQLHPTAIIDPGARLAEGVEVGPYAVIAGDVEIGADCRVGPHAVILPHTRIGARCRVHAHAVLGDLPQDLAFRNVVSHVVIGDECVIREGVTIHRGTREATVTRVGRGCYLMANSHLAHNVELDDQVILANGVLLAGYVQVGARAFVSGNVAVHQFCRVGRLAMLGGGSVVTKDVLPFCTTATAMRNRVAGINVVGLRRAGFTPPERMQVRRAFRLLYRSGLNVSQAMVRLREEFPDGPASEWVPFVAGSQRGLCGASRHETED